MAAETGGPSTDPTSSRPCWRLVGDNGPRASGRSSVARCRGPQLFSEELLDSSRCFGGGGSEPFGKSFGPVLFFGM